MMCLHNLMSYFNAEQVTKGKGEAKVVLAVTEQLR